MFRETKTHPRLLLKKQIMANNEIKYQINGQLADEASEEVTIHPVLYLYIG